MNADLGMRRRVWTVSELELKYSLVDLFELPRRAAEQEGLRLAAILWGRAATLPQTVQFLFLPEES